MLEIARGNRVTLMNFDGSLIVSVYSLNEHRDNELS